MTKRHRRRTMKGGFLETLSSFGSSISQGASDLWKKTKDATSSITGSTTPSPTQSYTQPTSTTTTTSSTTPMSYGGRKTRRRRMRGGFEDNTPLTGLAAKAAPFSGPTAQPHNWVGGKTKRRGRKSRKHRKH